MIDPVPTAAEGDDESGLGPYRVDLRGDIVVEKKGSVAGGMRLFAGTVGVYGPMTVDADGLTIFEGSMLNGTGTVSLATTVRDTLALDNSPGVLPAVAPVTDGGELVLCRGHRWSHRWHR
ncbi:Hypothetical protein HVPorG_05068 (plasmid) [Roseomonas mucosa]|uniref:Uncharacterized protein n=1 Tax=Roseomonas mucosa TaxID=207340 RepID=A0A4Y1MR77_9PROT|nr:MULTISPECIES: hypothetical protein [Roseomonas]AWV20457.1 Hypothetical protein RADP37_05068 [Roseomonas mucosa]MDT8356708.1 hypothetical protein [Roseomonas mucosa]MDU7525080.1 hypothetical protein [Roseomonas mucosa]QDJ11806.1 Hypothetical protein HVPorG_05068 [Roseomonas mucosa]USQ73891.1 hypothetical protein NF552_21585 [Roseomonas mucosa]